MPTVTFTAQLLVDPVALPAEEPLAYEGFMSAAEQGFDSETRRLWTLDGRLAVENSGEWKRAVCADGRAIVVARRAAERDCRADR